MSHPYADFENTDTWKCVEDSIKDLCANNDLELLTDRAYVVGYFCAQLDKLQSGTRDR